MCIRDSFMAEFNRNYATQDEYFMRREIFENNIKEINKINTCLLYTSDAADERSSVDLGGRRIIKTKNT